VEGTKIIVTWELLVQALHHPSGRPHFVKTTRRMAGASLEVGASLLTGSWSCGPWLRITCSLTHSTRLSCVHTLRREAQEIAHRVTTASSVMGPMSCECTKAILDPRITVNNNLAMEPVMEMVTGEGQSRRNSSSSRILGSQ